MQPFSDLLVHILVLPWILLVLFTLRPGGPEKSYELNRKHAFRFLPGKWKDKSYYVLWTRRLGVMWLVILSVFYTAILTKPW